MKKLAQLFKCINKLIGDLTRGFRFKNIPNQENYLEIAKIVRKMAETGIGTDACLELNCLPMMVHYYSPVPDIEDLIKRDIWSQKRALPGIDFRLEKQFELLALLGQEYGNECQWPLYPANDLREFHLINGNFSYGCAAMLHTMIRHYKPRHVIEIGSGNSSKVISKALSLNSDVGTEYTIVDPYPSDVVRNRLSGISHLIEQRVELLDLSIFNQLRENDILFIDSGHTVRTGSDVNFLFLDSIPNLAPGVFIHFHDIEMPYEYAKVYFTNPSFRVFWTEDYLLQAFLTFNNEFEILLAMNLIQTDHMDAFCKAFPYFDPTNKLSTSGSFWIRRKNK